jgi:phosphoglycolate phosphatase
LTPSLAVVAISRLVFWDIDGTLLSTGRAGIGALAAAAREVLGHDVDLDETPTSGLTDGEIAVAIAQSVGVELDPEAAGRFLGVYERELPAALSTRAGRVLPNVRQVLGDLQGDPRVMNLLLTGNTRAGASAKLAHYGLSDLLSDGAFCVGTRSRAEIARDALCLAEEAGAHVPPSGRFVVGDTPRDVRCAEAIEARCIAVATGAYDADALRDTGAWLVVDELPEPSVFRELIGLASS